MPEKNLNKFSYWGILFVTVAIVFGIGATVLSDMEQQLGYLITGTTARTSNLQILNSSATLQLSPNITTGSVVVINATGGETLTAANYTVSNSLGTLIGTTLNSYNNTAVNISYTTDVYETTTADALRNGTNATAELSSWLPTLALVLAASIIIGIVLAYFGVRLR